MTNPVQLEIPASAPRVRSNRMAWLGRQGLKLFGWTVEGRFPDQSKLIAIAAPHKSNWDWVLGVFALWATGLKFSYFIKNTVMVWPLSSIVLSTGGVPVDRESPEGVIEQAAAAFSSRDKLYFAITPEGTRKEVSRWKSGFLRIAYAARVPVVPVFIDYGNKAFRVYEALELTGDMDTDLEISKNFYKELLSESS